MASSLKVFISYSGNSSEHQQWVRAMTRDCGDPLLRFIIL
jgi:hypothetical protein